MRFAGLKWRGADDHPVRNIRTPFPPTVAQCLAQAVRRVNESRCRVCAQFQRVNGTGCEFDRINIGKVVRVAQAAHVGYENCSGPQLAVGTALLHICVNQLGSYA